MAEFPVEQTAVQLTGPDQLRLNRSKPVSPPGPHQVLARVEAVGLCFSDLKLLKQFSRHARKQPVLSGIDPAILQEIPSYVPGEMPGVPGHEAVVRIVAAGTEVKDLPVGGRFLVQTDYRWLPTAESNASFGYNFEGGLQEYVLMDQRVITAPDGVSMLIPVADDLPASAVALIEPWACVENAYAAPERNTLLPGGRLLVAGRPTPAALHALKALLSGPQRPAKVYWSAALPPPEGIVVPVTPVPGQNLHGETFEDVIVFGNAARDVEWASGFLAARGLLLAVLCGGTLGQHVTLPIGRIHYGGCRFAGTAGPDPAQALAAIPATGEVRPNDRIHVIGAGGPMGVMHVVRLLCQGISKLRLMASDMDATRLEHLQRLTLKLAQEHGLEIEYLLAGKGMPPATVDYVALMVPSPGVLAESLATAAPRAIINIFAGIPADVYQAIDMDAYIAGQMYFIGTSGSVIRDMLTVLEKVTRGHLDTNLSVAAVSGMAGAIDGIRAVEQRAIDGKIVVYPACRELGLTRLGELPVAHPGVAAALQDGCWTGAAEQELLAGCSRTE